ncbi:hypothetical protein [Muricoccus aerilatus]|uniref:hypothetical protein n=1 Tax=Muricoccus aerilatus TaxID=452982 RepID=UPI0005C13D91|nr:hypothetical protein [Roseomonas aerilata]
MAPLMLIRRPLTTFGWRLFSLFRDPPSYAEFGSAVGVAAYGASFFVGGKGPEAWSSLELLTDALPDWWWAAATIAGALAQFIGLYLGNRFIRFAAAGLMLLWVAFMGCFVWPIYPYSPLLVGFSVQLAMMNLLVVARHVRDW